MKQIVALIYCLISLVVSAQKETQQTIEASQVKSIHIKSDEVFKITMSTSSAESITIRTASEGEYFQNMSLITELKGNTLNITSTYPQILTSGYDKLSAHKVFAVQVFIEIPKNLRVTVTSNVASVYASGDYEQLQIELKSGQCELKDFDGDLLVNTFSGNIYVASQPAIVEAVSRHGYVENKLKYISDNILKLKTLEGDITVVESQ